MKNIIRKLNLLAFMLGVIIFSTNFIYAAENGKPIIETKTFPNGSSVTVTLPNGFSGKVMTNCYNGVCTSTTSPITEKEIIEERERINKQMKAIDDFFRQQREFFRKLFDNDFMWGW